MDTSDTPDGPDTGNDDGDDGDNGAEAADSAADDAAVDAADMIDGEACSDSGPSEIEYDVPAEATVRTCEDCGRPFPDDTLLALHRGRQHEHRLSAGDRETVATARSAESKRLRLFRLKALAVLVVLYFALLMVYAVVT